MNARKNKKLKSLKKPNLKYPEMKKLLLLFFLLVAAVTVQAQNEKPAAPKHRVIMQLTQNNPDAHKQLMNQLNALKQAWGDDVVVEVLAHGPGIELFLLDKTTQKEMIATMKTKGVHFVMCENTMKNKGITKEMLLPDMEYAPFGLAEIITKQEEGWIYIKAGF